MDSSLLVNELCYKAHCRQFSPRRTVAKGPSLLIIEFPLLYKNITSFTKEK